MAMGLYTGVLIHGEGAHTWNSVNSGNASNLMGATCL